MADRRSRSRWLRKRLRLSIRGLIAVILLVGGGLGWIIHQAKLQRDCVTAVTRAQGEVIYNWYPDRQDPSLPVPLTPSTQGPGLPGQAGGSDTETWAPRWLVDRLGVDYFAHVICVRLPVNVERIDAPMASVAHLSRLVLCGTDISDAGLASLEALDQLQVLYLSETQIGDAGLAHLAGLTRLEWLKLDKTRITDAGLVHLKGLKNLKLLFLMDTRASTAAVQELAKGLPNVTWAR